MQQRTLTVRNATGLHARPAKIFVNTAKQFKADIRVQHGEKKANAKSLISMLTLGVESGQEILIVVDGEDEVVALATLVDAVESGLGEGEPEAVSAPAQAGEPAPPAVQPAAAQPASDGVLRGIAGAPGIAIGPIFQLRQDTLEVDNTFGTATEEEVRLAAALAQAREQLTTLHKQMLQGAAAKEAAIFEVHLELLEDSDLLDAVLAAIRQGNNAARAWQTTIESRAKAVAALADPLLAGRAADLHDVGYRVLRLLVGAEDSGSRWPDHPVILAAHDLSPSQTAALDPGRVLGICTAAGGPTAHAAIIARALTLPAVVSVGAGILDVANGTVVVLDGNAGTVAVAPDGVALARAEQAQAAWRSTRAASLDAAGQPAITVDGHRVEVVANIGGLKDAQKAVAAGAEGVGLLRTEFLFLDRADPPGEEEQVTVYRDIALAMQGRPVIVRTLDIGGDKPLPYIQVPHESNPFLGERGIRLCLNRPELLRQQVRAILRASTAGPLRIMFPMVADVTEWRRARALVEEVRVELGVPAVPLGIMIEVPSAALMTDAFAREVDFFSVGTNDLTQYTLAVDRQHPSLAAMSDGLHPAVLRLIARVVEAAHAEGKWVGVCGELGADPAAVPILVGLGVDELSIGVPAIPTVKAQIRGFSRAQAQAHAQRALACATAAEVRALAE